jgi:hypothetical protein
MAAIDVEYVTRVLEEIRDRNEVILEILRAMQAVVPKISAPQQ